MMDGIDCIMKTFMLKGIRFQVQLSVSIDEDKKVFTVDSPDCVASKWSPLTDNANNKTGCIVDASESTFPVKRPSNLNLTSLSQPVVKCKRTENYEEVPLNLSTVPISNKVYEEDFNILDDPCSATVVTNQSCCYRDGSDDCPNTSFARTVSDDGDSVDGKMNDCPSSTKSTGSDQQEHEHESASGVWI